MIPVNDTSIIDELNRKSGYASSNIPSTQVQDPELISQLNEKYASQNTPMIHHPLLGDIPDPRHYNLGKDPNFRNEVIQTVAGMPGSQLLNQGISVAGKGIQSGFNYLHPQRIVNQFMEKIGGGKTAPENTEELAKRLHFARSSAAEEALAHKAPVIEALGDKNIFNPLISHVIKNIEAPTYYSSGAKMIFNRFKNNPSLNNVDKLQRQLGEEIRQIRFNQLMGQSDAAMDERLMQLTQDRNALTRHTDRYMERQDPELKNQYDLFRTKWKNNVAPYDENALIANIARSGKTEGIKPGQISSVFGTPEQFAQKIAADIGPSGFNNILYNELQSATPLTAKELGESLGEMKQFGFQKYMTPEMETLAKVLPTRYNVNQILKNTALGTVSGTLLGHPLVGALLGVGFKTGADTAKKAIKMIKE